MAKYKFKKAEFIQKHHEVLLNFLHTFGVAAILEALASYHKEAADSEMEEASYKLGRKRQIWTAMAKDQLYGAEVLKKTAARLAKRGVSPAPLFHK